MSHLTFLQTTTALVIAIFVFIVVLLSYWAGHSWRKRVLKRDPELEKTDIKAINGMLIGLLGLLLAFTFSMSNTRYDDRRHLIVQEANIIGTTILRADMYPDSMRNALRSALSEYVECRIAHYDARRDFVKAMTKFREGQVLSAKVWRMAAEYSKKNGEITRTAQLIPSINEMIDITSTRLAASEGTIPDSILYFLFILSACTSFLMGYDQGSKIEWTIVGGFALALAATIFSIVDLDRPRSGLINMDGPAQKIVELRKMFKE